MNKNDILRRTETIKPVTKPSLEGYETVAEFLKRGGSINKIPDGVSARHNGLTKAQQETADRYRKKGIQKSRQPAGYKLINGRRVYPSSGVQS